MEDEPKPGEFETDSRIRFEGEWDEELARRMEEIVSGKVKGIPAEEVFAQMRSKYGQDAP